MFKKLFVTIILLTQVAFAKTTVVTVGTGSPIPTPHKMGPATLVIVDETPYLFDAGAGVQRRIQESINNNPEKLKGVKVENITNIFLTHVHSDHILGLDEMIFGAWSGNSRKDPIDIYGPIETPELVSNLEKTYKSDVHVRLHGAEPATPEGYKATGIATKIDEVIYKDDKISVTAFKVDHGSWEDARGYLVETKDGKKIIIGGDNADPSLFIPYGENADMIVSEVYTLTNFGEGTFMLDNKDFWLNYFSEFHTSTKDLAQVMKTLKPKNLVTTHEITFNADSELILKEIKDFGYEGKVISSEDMQVFDL